MKKLEVNKQTVYWCHLLLILFSIVGCATSAVVYPICINEPIREQEWKEFVSAFDSYMGRIGVDGSDRFLGENRRTLSINGTINQQNNALEWLVANARLPKYENSNQRSLYARCANFLRENGQKLIESKFGTDGEISTTFSIADVYTEMDEARSLCHRRWRN